MNKKLISNQPPQSTGKSYSETPLKSDYGNIGAFPQGKVGWICPICGRALSPDTICCPFCWGHNNQPTCIIYGTGKNINPNYNAIVSTSISNESQSKNIRGI